MRSSRTPQYQTPGTISSAVSATAWHSAMAGSSHERIGQVGPPGGAARAERAGERLAVVAAAAALPGGQQRSDRPSAAPRELPPPHHRAARVAAVAGPEDAVDRRRVDCKGGRPRGGVHRPAVEAVGLPCPALRLDGEAGRTARREPDGRPRWVVALCRREDGAVARPVRAGGADAPSAAVEHVDAVVRRPRVDYELRLLDEGELARPA